MKRLRRPSIIIVVLLIFLNKIDGNHKDTRSELSAISSQIGPKSNRPESNRPQSNRPKSNRPQVKSAPSQIGPRSNRPQSNRPQSNRHQVKSAPSYIYIIKWKYRYLTLFFLLNATCLLEKQKYLVWHIISYWKMILCLFLVAKARVPSVILSSWCAVLSGQIDVPYVYINHWLWWIFVNVLKWIFSKGCRKNLGISGIWSCWFKGIWFVFTVFNRQ
jgi:hypothetical protein